MPSPSLGMRSKKARFHKDVPADQRLAAWFKRIKVGAQATTKRPLRQILPEDVRKANDWHTNVAWLIEKDELRLGTPEGPIIS